jgi:hypothetical protein
MEIDDEYEKYYNQNDNSDYINNISEINNKQFYIDSISYCIHVIRSINETNIFGSYIYYSKYLDINDYLTTVYNSYIGINYPSFYYMYDSDYKLWQIHINTYLKNSIKNILNPYFTGYDNNDDKNEKIYKKYINIVDLLPGINYLYTQDIHIKSISYSKIMSDIFIAFINNFSILKRSQIKKIKINKDIKYFILKYINHYKYHMN